MRKVYKAHHLETAILQSADQVRETNKIVFNVITIFNHLVSNTLFRIPLDFDYSIGGVSLWLATVVVLSALASLWPAMRATQVSVQEALSYE